MKQTVAQLYPAREQPDGTVWYRSGGRANDGWGSNIEQADPSYRAADAPAPIPFNPAETLVRPPTEQEVEIIAAGVGEAFDRAELFQPPQEEQHPMTALTEDFEVDCARTEWMGYPLPPEPPRPPSRFNGWRWYKLPSPTTGRETGYPRATTISRTLDDREGLSKWKRRETAKRIYQLSQLDPETRLNPRFPTTAGSALENLVKAMGDDKVSTLDHALETIDNLMGGAEASELGKCAHAWLEAIACGIVLMRDVPDIVRPHVENGRRVLAHRGIIPLPQYGERTVLNDQGEEDVAGKIDGIGLNVTTGELVLLDVKTGKTLEYSWLDYGVQVGGVYGWATKILNDAGDGWDVMPEINRDYAVLLHIPSNSPEHTAAITIDLEWGAEVMVESLAVRRLRKEAKHEVPKHALPVPSAVALRYTAARFALSEIESLDEGQAVYEAYSDVWDEDLDSFASTVAELL